jgi:Recombination endonuclease VII
MNRRNVRTHRSAPTALAPRRFGLSRRKIVALQGKFGTDELPNPFNAGFYRYLVEALKRLGVNRPHPRKAVIAAFRELANARSTYKNGGTFWRRWKGKDASLPWSERFDQNVEVLQRVPRPGVSNNTPYGLKLLEVGTELLRTRGAVIDILRAEDGQKLFRLNTDSGIPQNDFRNRRENSHKAQVARFRQSRALAQDGMCAICGRKRRRLCVDHCHRHGHLRGLLCGRCNSGVGFFSDSPPLLLRAALYLMATVKADAEHPAPAHKD